jgi:CheY-like chemotaxis protein
MAEILLIDDSEFDRKLVLSLLAKEQDWTGTGCRSGEEALQLLDEKSFDLVITDLKMPGIDGLQVIKEIHNRFSSLPVILITSFGNEDVALQALQQGAANYIPKRAVSERLADSVKTVLSAARRERQRDGAQSYVTTQTLNFRLPSDRGAVPGVVAWVQDLAVEHGIAEDSDAVRLGVALEEALLNAIIHGNLEVGSQHREGDGLLYEEFIELHMTQEPFRSRCVTLAVEIDEKGVSLQVTDEGPGFDIREIPDPTDPENLLRPSGRGLLLIHAFMDEVKFNDKGNSITLMRRRPVRTTEVPSPVGGTNCELRRKTEVPPITC